ncbi:MAG: class I SAM-dependent methyltransferase [Armatimonadota bacterium]|nr:class I SAM-dependent methyltransferase [Armatimonadota bacterium]
MSGEFRAGDWDSYTMTYGEPFAELEPLADEIAVVDEALQELVAAGALPHAEYDTERFLAHRAAVRQHFEVPWTAITPRMERLIWAINAIRRPARMIAAGVFCGFTFICNAGAGAGPGAVYEAEDLVGVEIKPDEAQRAERNAREIDRTGTARAVAADAVEFAAQYPHAIDLLYLDADGDRGRGKGIYLEILEAALDRLTPGAVVLAHNSVNSAERLAEYLTFVRDPARFTASVNVILDGDGLEVSAL